MQHKNNLTPVQEELIGLLQEEAAEIIQELSKIRRTGFDFCRRGKDVPNQIFLQRELMDFKLLLQLASRADFFEEYEFDGVRYQAEKRSRLKEWTNLPHDFIESI